MLGLTLVLLLAVIVVGEFAICVLMAAPIFYLAAIVESLMHRMHERRDTRADRDDDGSPARSAGLALIPLLLLSLEGTPIGPSFDREEKVSAVRVVDATPAEVREANGRPLRYQRPLPRFLRLGFPRPVAARGEGLSPGDR